MEIILRPAERPHTNIDDGTIYLRRDMRGTLELLCPSCGALVVSQASEELLADLRVVQCWNCRGWATGERRKR
jgi:hypothetical protein